MCIVSIHIIALSYMFKQCFKSLERSVIHKLTEGDSLPLKKAPILKILH